jgi:GcrA cell cycle regulator
MPDNTWTTERVELLKIHFTAGLSCREIANEIGVSRNAVIGKLSRLSLTREKTLKPRRDDGGRRDYGGKSRPKSVPRLQYRMLRQLFAEAPPPDNEPILSEQHCSLLELSKERCRWPISSPGEKDFCFCGNLPLEGLPYCPGHTRLAYAPGSRQRRAAMR